MQERTFDCAQCQADRASTRAANTTCQRPGCDNPLPPGSRADRKWCSSACQVWVSRRNTGRSSRTTGRCSSCLQPLAGMYANAKVCRSGKCRVWAQRHPGVPHPSVASRMQAVRGVDRPSERQGEVLLARLHECSGWLSRTARGTTPRPAPGRRPRRARRIARRTSRRTLSGASSGLGTAARRTRSGTRGTGSSGPPANPEAAAELGRIRRARRRAIPDSIGVSVRDWERMVARYRGCCATAAEGRAAHMDHVVPLAKGGRHAIGNVLPACGRCNVRKHAMFLSVWRYRGRRRLLSA
jgi:hypothetical protein